MRDAILADEPGGHHALAVVVRVALGSPALSGWMVWPVAEAVASTATESARPADFDDGLALLAALTPRSTGEFAIRTFLNTDLDRTLGVVATWIKDDDPAVRRLAGERTRPRLPWAKRVPEPARRPAATLPLLDLPYRDPSDFVRRSVANHLRRHLPAGPGRRGRGGDALVGGARRPHRRPGWTLGHSMRTLVKQGSPEALALLGLRGDRETLRVVGPTPRAKTVAVGHDLTFDARVTNTADEPVTPAIDYVIHYLKANGASAPRVFTLAKRTLAAAETVDIARRQSFRPVSTRRLHPGAHALVQINGHRFGHADFTLRG